MVGGASRPSTTTCGSSTTATTTTARPATSPPSNPEMLAKLQRLWLIEATKYNVLPIDDRTGRTARTRAGRPTDPDPRQHPTVLRRHGPAVGEQCRQHQEQVVLDHRRDRRTRGRRRRRDHRPGRTLRRLGGVLQGRARPSSPTTCSGSKSSPPRPTRHLRREASGADGVRLRRRRTGQRRRRHPLLRRHRCRQRSGRRDPADGLLSRRDDRHRLRVRHHCHPRLHRRTAAGSRARSTGSNSMSASTTTTTSSIPRNASGSPWPANRARQ